MVSVGAVGGCAAWCCPCEDMFTENPAAVLERFLVRLAVAEVYSVL